jgi:hypothetical protein
MFSIKVLPEFTAWLDGLADVAARGATDCTACGWIQAHAEERHKARQSTGGITGLTGGNRHEQTH